jgi:XTP/dITP diphosphohydrolase
MPAGLAWITTSHRVAPGLLSHRAWQALASATVYRPAEHPLAALVAGVDLTDLAEPVHRAAREPVAVLIDAADAPALSAALAAALNAADPPPTVEAIPGSWDAAGARLLDLVAVMDRLRSPGGCPWDAEQTHRTLLPYLIEEAYETVEAIEVDDSEALREELGDLLLQVVFHARLAQEGPGWGIDDVAAGITEKLVRRHPHVFARPEAATAAEVEAGWEQAKKAEKGRDSAVDGVPMAQPALSLASALVSRSAKHRVAVDLPSLPAGLSAPQTTEEVGELLLAVVAAARTAGIDPEAALREAARGFAGRIRAAEAHASD